MISKTDSPNTNEYKNSDINSNYQLTDSEKAYNTELEKLIMNQLLMLKQTTSE